MLLILADLHYVTHNLNVAWLLIPVFSLFNLWRRHILVPDKKFEWAILKQYSHLTVTILLSEHLDYFLFFVVSHVVNEQGVWWVILSFKFDVCHPFAFEDVVDWHKVSMSEEKIVST